ncbi:MAG: hypothetical protein PHH55_04830, partial [Candidatus Delongbacteria bacterium]|nr:hypothetical protein [Candidatus Delongbacteria bacterium]
LYKLAKVLNTAIGRIKDNKEEAPAEAAPETTETESGEMTLGLESANDSQETNLGPEDEKDVYPNSGKKWTREDEEKLEFLFKAGKTVEDLTEIFGRKQKGIESRLQKLGLTE